MYHNKKNKQRILTIGIIAVRQKMIEIFVKNTVFDNCNLLSNTLNATAIVAVIYEIIKLIIISVVISIINSSPPYLFYRESQNFDKFQVYSYHKNSHQQYAQR